MAVPLKGVSQVTDTLDLGELLITASKIPTTERETTKPFTTITRAEIEQHPGASVTELLSQQNGVMINGAFSNPGKDKSVYLRGASTQYTLVLIDGFPVKDPSSEGGAFDLRLMSLENVERIEVVKGSMSTLYGSDAIAGVINIITKKPTEDTVNINGKASYGSFNSNELALGASGKKGVVGYSVNFSRAFTEGISEAESDGNSDFKTDGFDRRAINAQVNIEPIKGLLMIPFANYSTYKGDYDAGAFQDGDNVYEADLLNTGARFRYEVGDFIFHEAATFSMTERTFTDDFGVFNPKATLFNSDFFTTYNKFDNVRFLGGFNLQQLDFEIDQVDEGSQILSPYLTTYLKSGFGLNAELGVRLNHHSEYGTNWNFSIAPVYNLNPHIKFLTSLSSGFKAPTLNEMFGPFGENPELNPQESLTFDIGTEFRLYDPGFTASVNYFYRSIDNLISYDAALGYINVNEQNDQGAEVSVRYEMQRTNVDVYYNYLEGAITQNGEETDNLIRRPTHSFGATINQQITKHLFVNLNGQYVGERDDLFFNPDMFVNESVELDPYVLINLSSRYQLLEDRLTLFVSVNNLTNADYYEVYGFNTPGIHYKAGLKFSY
jgi:vitamin B12 transporter